MIALTTRVSLAEILTRFFFVLLFAILALGFYGQIFDEESSSESRYSYQDDKSGSQKHASEKIKHPRAFTNDHYIYSLGFNFYFQRHLDKYPLNSAAVSFTYAYRAPPATA
jgi:hypothetical protein